MKDNNVPKSLQRMISLNSGEDVNCPICGVGRLHLVNEGATIVRCTRCDYSVVGRKTKSKEGSSKNASKFVATF